MTLRSGSRFVAFASLLLLLPLSLSKAQDGSNAHGYLMAEELVPFVEEFVVKLPIVGSKKYVDRVAPYVSKNMTFSADEEEEIAGMIEGVMAKLGASGARLESLGRPIEALDVKIGNTFGDWAPFACSSFTVWGAATADGGTLTARNFDYFPHPKLKSLVTLIARAPKDPSRRRWVNVGYPGLLGVISGMNEDGVGLFVHDVMPKGDSETSGLTPRLLSLRRALETTGPENAVETIYAKLRATTTRMGNNVQATSPFDGKTAPGGIIEYDGVESLRDGADLRRAAEGKPYVVCSNHYRSRAEPSACRRYASIQTGIEAAIADGKTIDAALARAIMATATQKSFASTTLHTVVFLPAKKSFELMIAADGKVAPACEPTSWTLDELLPPR
jgi:hypothetical protein